MMMTAKGEIYQPSTDAPPMGINTAAAAAAAAGEATGSLPILDNEERNMMEKNQATSNELWHSSEEDCAGADPESRNSNSTSRDRSAASPKSASSSNIPERTDDGENASSIATNDDTTATAASPSLKAILASQRNERDKEISLLSPQPMMKKKLLRSPAWKLADPCSSSEKQQERHPNSVLFSPPPTSASSSSGNNSEQVNLSTSSLESIGKISERDLLSPIPPSGNHENMRLSVATAGGDDGAAAAAAVDDGTAALSSPLRHNPFQHSGESSSTTAATRAGFMEFSIGLRGPAQSVALLFDDEECMNDDDDEEELPPEPVSTPNKPAADTGESSFFVVHETLLRSPCPTILEAEHEDETESEPSNDDRARTEPEMISSTTANEEDTTAENYVEWQQPRGQSQDMDGKENNDSADPSPSRLANALSPLKFIRSAESRRSLNLIERLRRNSFRRKMSVPGDGPDEASLSLLDDDADDDEQDSQVHANDVSVSVIESSLSHNDTKTPKNEAVLPAVEATSRENDYLPPPPFEESNSPPERVDGSIDSSSSLGSLAPGGSTDEADLHGYSHGENKSVQGRRQLSVDNLHLQGSGLSVSSSTNNESTRAKQGIGASSMAFIEQLRGAALRRKMNLSRSRDSLAAKERKQREDIAASEATRLQKEDLARQAAEALERKNRRKSLAAMPSSTLTHTFKARPVPQANGLLGSGGLAGVPKVEKKPTTTPISPYLGPRRQLRQQSATSSDSHPNDVSSKEAKQVQNADQSHFKARPLPKTTGALGGAGHSGVPKVPKRQVTVPFSPLLGSRRKPPPKAVQVEGRPKLVNSDVDDRRRSSNASQMSGSSGQSLLGVAICNQKENNVERAAATATPTNVATMAFVPRSTARAKKRAEFEAERKEKEQQRKEKERRERNEQLKALRKELQKLRSNI